MIVSRGIPSKEALHLPPYSSVKRFQDDNETPTRNLWPLEDVVNFLFPKKYQPTYNEIATKFIRELCEKLEMGGKDIGEFLRRNNFSKATFYNRVFPKLRRMGLIKVRRETLTNLESKRKYRPMRVSLSKTFGNYLMKIADSWLAIVDEARSKKM